jgi:CRP-like cAMP-binding protein
MMQSSQPRERPPAVWNELEQNGIVYEFPRGVRLLAQGEHPRAILLLQNGAAKLGRIASDGSETIVGWRFAGAMLGSAAALASRPSPVFIETTQPSLICQIKGDTFARILQQNSFLASEVCRQQADELCEQFLQSAGLATLDATERCLAILACFFRRQGIDPDGVEESRVQLPGTFGDLARSIGVRPETLSRLLLKLETQGFLRREKGWIVIKDAQRLLRERLPTSI